MLVKRKEKNHLHQRRGGVKRGDVVEVSIRGSAFGGEGVGRIDGQVVFVPFAVPGDLAEVEVLEVKKAFARGRALRILQPSADRIEPRCSAHGRCGGCCYQQLRYERQLALKETQAAEIFRRIGGIPEPPVKPILASPLPFRYRDRAEFHFRTGGDGRLQAGFMQWREHRIQEIDRCEIVHRSIEEKFLACRDKLRGREGLSVNRKVLFWSDEESAQPGAAEEVAGRGCVLRHVRGQSFLVPAEGFFQANGSLTGALVDAVTEACGLRGTEVVLDAYSGSGLFALFLAPRAGRVVGIERDPAAVRCARLNAERLGVRNADFLCGDAAVPSSGEASLERSGADVVVLDPPRIGLGSGAAEGLARLRPKRIVYVSCDPATQARDIRRLTDLGFALRSLQPLDMFPQTSHVEIVGLLEAR
jgi:23S rRNA (uracil1939-C5)-methyltransferase